jgi:hypothetical protein
LLPSALSPSTFPPADCMVARPTKSIGDIGSLLHVCSCSHQATLLLLSTSSPSWMTNDRETRARFVSVERHECTARRRARPRRVRPRRASRPEALGDETSLNTKRKEKIRNLF